MLPYHHNGYEMLYDTNMSQSLLMQLNNLRCFVQFITTHIGRNDNF